MGGAKAGANEQRELMRKKREERRKHRDEHIAEFDTAPGPGAGSKRKKSKPKARKKRDSNDAKLKHCDRFRTFLVKLVHVLDALIGLTFIIYGSLIMTQFKKPAMEAVVTTWTYGFIMLFTSIMGVIGFYSPRYKRVGLLISAYSAPIISFFYIFVMIAELGLSASIFDYLTENMGVLYLNEAEIATLKNVLPLFFVVLVSLTAIEICRFLLLSQLREGLVRFDSANSRTKSSKGKRSSKKPASPEGAGSTRSGLTNPLLDEEEAGNIGEKEGDY